jgi:hypothetical protein
MHRSRLGLALACGALAATGYAAGSFAQAGSGDRTATTERQAGTGERRARPPSELWGRFPLGEPTPEQVPRTSAQQPSRRLPPAAVQPGASDGSELLLLLAGVVALLLLGPALLVALELRRRTPKGAATAPSAPGPRRRRAAVSSNGSTYVAVQRERLLRAMASGSSRERVDAARAVAIHALECDMFRARNAEGRNEPVEENTVVRPAVEGEYGDETPVEDEAVQGKTASRDYAEFGDRVAAVLQAAEEAAEQIRADAKAAAEQMTLQAEQEANTRLEEASREAERVRTEAHAESKNTREAVEIYATNHRREAEERAAKLVTDAESQARASREAAEAMAQRIEESARGLEEEAREQERIIRGRMQRYLAALRDVSRQIEEVLSEPARSGETLVEALDVERARNE